MAPVATYDPPHVQLGRLFVAARRRGDSFEAFWSEAVRPGRTLVMTTHPCPPPGAVLWPTDRNDRQAWQSAIVGARETWRRAYEREEPTRGERALAVLGDAIGAAERAERKVAGGEPVAA